MNKFIVLLLSIIISTSAYSQFYKNTYSINQTDTFLLNKAVLTENNDLITASLMYRDYPVGGVGVLGVYTPGQLVLRKLDSTFNEIWKVDFPESKAVVFDIQIHNNNNMLIAGAYYDTLVFPNNDTLFGDNIRANEFIASFDMNGNYNWSYANQFYQHYSKYISKFFILNNKIYYPYSTDSTSTSMQVLSLNGDSLDDFQLSQSRVLISDIEVNSNNEVYFSGTCEPNALFAGDSIYHTQQNISYMTFLVKTDSNFNQLWSKGLYYITFDLHPEIEIFNNEVAFLYNHMDPQNFNSINYYALNYYNQNSNLNRHDSVAEGTFSHMHKHKSLLSANNKLYLSKTMEFNKLGVYSIDNQYNYQLLSSIKSYSVKGIPDFTANNEQLFLTYSTNDEYSIINDVDTFWNPNYMIDSSYWSYQQIVMQHLYDSTATSIDDFTENNELVIYPNPATEIVTIKNNSRIQRIDVFNIEGQLIHSKSIDEFNYKLRLNNSGLYIIRINTKNGTFYRKVIVD